MKKRNIQKILKKLTINFFNNFNFIFYVMWKKTIYIEIEIKY